MTAYEGYSTRQFPGVCIGVCTNAATAAGIFLRGQEAHTDNLRQSIPVLG